MEALPHCIRGALVPGGVIRGLLCRQYVYKGFTEMAEVVGILNMLVQRGRIVLREHKYAVHIRVQAVGDRYIYQPVFTSQGHGRFGTTAG
jgi:hypothetical protein